MPAQGIHIRRAGNPQREGRQDEDKKLRAELCNVKGEERKNREEGVTVHSVLCIYCTVREKVIQECINPIAAGDLKWIYAGYWSRSEQ